ncbi:hypothetical protein [Kitasatospora phosalacinea]|uniref:hypothetical protein n=1 Tax=Kitasatospora phosalacinea TaxID=2065 RepID=UPI000524F218|nr:hypothetical protein [Kitasatospora phosalacinea]
MTVQTLLAPVMSSRCETASDRRAKPQDALGLLDGDAGAQQHVQPGAASAWTGQSAFDSVGDPTGRPDAPAVMALVPGVTVVDGVHQDRRSGSYRAPGQIGGLAESVVRPNSS